MHTDDYNLEIILRTLHDLSWEALTRVEKYARNLKKANRPPMRHSRAKKKKFVSPERFRHKLLISATAAELKMKELLDADRIQYEFQSIVNVGKVYVVDFLLPRLNDRPLIIELDGGYHKKKKQMAADREREAEIEKRIGPVLRFDNDSIVNDSDRVMLNIRARHPIHYATKTYD